MLFTWKTLVGLGAITAIAASITASSSDDTGNEESTKFAGGPPTEEQQSVTVGPRPYFLLETLEAGALKDKLIACRDTPQKKSNFSIGHRGAALQFSRAHQGILRGC